MNFIERFYALFSMVFLGLIIRDTSFAQAPFLPTDIPRLELWLRADTLVVDSLGYVKLWQDISVNGNDAFQNDINVRPTLVPVGPKFLNDHSVVRFSNSRLVLSDFLSTSSGKVTVFVAYKVNDVSGGNFGVSTIISLKNGLELFALGSTILGFPSPFFRGETNGQSLGCVSFKSVNVRDTFPHLISLAYDGLNPSDTNSYSGSYNAAKKFLSNEGGFSPAFSSVIGDRDQAGYFLKGDIAEIIVYDTIISDSLQGVVESYLHTRYAPPVNIGGDIIMNNFCDTLLDAGSTFLSYLWSTGQTTQSILANKGGDYFVTVVDVFGYTSLDTITISYPGNFNPFPDTTICLGDTLVWNTQLDKAGYTFQWQDNSTDSVFYITQAGQYYVTVTDSFGCSRESDTIIVSIDNFVQTVSLGPDTSYCSGASVSLVSGAPQAVSYLWQPGGQTTSAISVTLPNTYTVSVANANGCTATDSVTISIKGVNPTVNFSSTTECFPNPTQFTDLTLPNPPDSTASWLWNFGDGSPLSTLSNPSHSYAAADTFNVTLTVVTDSGCTASAQFPVFVHPKPAANFSTAPSPACSGAPLFFSDASSVFPGSINAWFWNFGDGSTLGDTANQNAPNYSYNLPGAYSVTLVASSSAGCMDTVIKTVNIQQTPVVTFTADTACVMSPTSFNGSSSPATLPILTWQWDFGDATGLFTGNPIQHPYSAAGTYTAVLTALANNGCMNTDTGMVVVNHIPTVVFYGDSACVNTPLQFLDSSYVTGSSISSWNWNFGDGGLASVPNPSHSYSAVGTYTVSLTLVSAQTCSASLKQPVVVMPLPVAGFSVSPSFISPMDVVSFTNLSSGASNYFWDFGDGSAVNTAVNPTHTYLTVGTYSVILVCQSGFGCISSYSDQVVVAYPLLDLAVTLVSGVNAGGVVQVSAFLKNIGTLDVNNFRLSTWLDNGTPVYETWSGVPLVPGGTKTYTFGSQFGQADVHSVVCVEIVEVNGEADDVPSNNKKCAAIADEFTVLDPFPNPTVDEITFFFVSPEPGEVKIEMYDARGRTVEKLAVESIKGLNQFTYNTVKLTKGIYAFRLTYKGLVVTKKFMKE